MPRAGDGSFSLPSGTLVNTGDQLLTSQHNPAMQDIAQALTNSLDRNGSGGMRSDLAMGGNRITGLAPGTSDTDAATVGQLVSGTGVPVGTIIDFAGASAPDGWLVCAGQSLSRTDYAELFAVLGTTYGSDSGATFSLPDCRGRVTAGKDVDQGGYSNRLSATSMTPDARTLGANGGVQTVALTSDQMPGHTHTVSGSTNSAGLHAHTVTTLTGALGQSGTDIGGAATNIVTTSSAGAHTHTLSGMADSTGGSQAHPNVQPTILFNKLIKASNS